MNPIDILKRLRQIQASMRAEEAVCTIYNLLDGIPAEEFEILLNALQESPLTTEPEATKLAKNKLMAVKLVAFLHREIKANCLPLSEARKLEQELLPKLASRVFPGLQPEQ